MIFKRKKTEKESDSFLRNELDANRQMIWASVFTAGFLVLVWLFYGVMYWTKFLVLAKQTYLMINIFFPINIVLLASTLIYRKTKFFERPSFKIFLLFNFIGVVTILNVILPKHTMLAWAIPILLANHYYRPKLGRMVFLTSAILMLLAMYAAMFVGEYDPVVLGPGVLQLNAETGLYEIYQPVDPSGRYQMLKNMIAEGNNRYVAAFMYFYVSRIIALTVIFFTSNALGIRTRRLLEREVTATNEKKQIETELGVAHEIQHNALPSEFTANKKVAILAELSATKEVGGDLYDYFYLDDDHIAFLIGDVSGKGVPAAMFMMKTITCFKAYASLERSPSEILRLVNKALYEGNNAQMFVTCFFGILDLKTGVLHYANAGHNPPIVGTNRDFHYLKCSSGFVLGVMEESFAIDEEVTLAPDEIVFLYTDGITEAKNIQNEFYGEERLLRICNAKDYSSIVEMNYEVIDDLHAFVGKAEQADDITYLFLRYNGDRFNVYEKIFPSGKETVEKVLDWMKETLRKEQTESLGNTLSVVLDELVSNIVKYGYPNGVGEVYLRLMFNVDKAELTITLVDHGVPFNPLEQQEEKIESLDGNIKEGRLGILIVKEMMDSLSYNRINNKNILVLKKKYEGGKKNENRLI